MAAEARKTGVDMSVFDKLQPLANQLNPATDELNEALGKIQEQLNRLGLGVEVWLPSPVLASGKRRQLVGEDRYGEEKVYGEEWTDWELGYGRIGEGWALLVRSRHYRREPNEHGFLETTAYDDEDEIKPLLNAARSVRVAAVPLLPNLADALEEAAQNVLQSVEQAKKIAESLK